MSRVIHSVLRYAKSLINDQRKCIVQFSYGTIVFLFGMITIVVGDYGLSPSVKQEIVVLVGVVLSGAGLFLVITAHICMMIFRLKHF